MCVTDADEGVNDAVNQLLTNFEKHTHTHTPDGTLQEGRTVGGPSFWNWNM